MRLWLLSPILFVSLNAQAVEGDPVLGQQKRQVAYFVMALMEKPLTQATLISKARAKTTCFRR